MSGLGGQCQRSFFLRNVDRLLGNDQYQRHVVGVRPTILLSGTHQIDLISLVLE